MGRSRLSLFLLLTAYAAIDAASNDGMIVQAGILADFVGSQSTVRPDDGKRMFTLQPSRDRAFGLMQGHIEMSGKSSTVWWRIAVQDGWFPQANYAGEDYPFRFLQEASFSNRVTDEISYTVGVFPSHFGYESMIARDNLTLSRSFTADNTPYYETGVSSTYTISEDLQVSLLLLNGWQRIIDINDDLSMGTALRWRADSSVTLSWNTYVGNDQPRDKPSLARFHNNVWCEWNPTSDLKLVGLFDIGFQQKPTSGFSVQWYAGLVSRYNLCTSLRIAARLEHYADPDAIIVQPPVGYAFAATAGSVNADYEITESILLRAECRRIQYNDQFINANTVAARSSETYFTLSISTRLTTGPL